MSAISRAVFISGRILCIILRGRGCDILNLHAPTDDKSDDTKDSFYMELERVFDQFSKYHIKIC